MTTPSENVSESENPSAESTLSFPQYQRPGLEYAERKQSDPLWKLAKTMLKPRHKLHAPRTKTHHHKRKHHS